MGSSGYRVNAKLGFTLLELVVTMLLIAIVAVTVAPKWFGERDFAGLLTQDRLISLIRAQQQALLAGQSCQLQVQADAMQLLADCHSEPHSLDGVVVQLQNQTDFTLTFDRNGIPLDNCRGGCTVTIMPAGANNNIAVCIESQGYAHSC